MLASLIVLATVAKPVLVGYLPSWRTDKYDFSRLAPLTDVCYFAIQPTAQGSLDTKDIQISDFANLAKAKQMYGFRVLICCGGWERSEGFLPTATDPVKRARFVKEAAAFCNKYCLDGIDLDWEHPTTPAQGEAYGDLIQDLHKALAPKHRIVTAAIADWQSMSQKAVDGLDRVHLMSYDHEGKHSTMESAKSDVDKLVTMGFPLSKIALGVPFYGRTIEHDSEMGYDEITAKFKPKPTDDQAGNYYFNGITMMSAKVAFAKQKGLAGVMIWEVTQDVEGSGSLLRTLKNGLDK